MEKNFELPITPRFVVEPDQQKASPERMLKMVRYVIGSVNDDALRAWSDVWAQFESGVTPSGMVLPEPEQGFRPACGWSQLFEKLWLLKHYLDYIQRYCKQA